MKKLLIPAIYNVNHCIILVARRPWKLVEVQCFAVVAARTTFQKQFLM